MSKVENNWNLDELNIRWKNPKKLREHACLLLNFFSRKGVNLKLNYFLLK